MLANALEASVLAGGGLVLGALSVTEKLRLVRQVVVNHVVGILARHIVILGLHSC